MADKIQIRIDVDTKSGKAEVKGLGKGMVSASKEGKRAFKGITRYARQAETAFKGITQRLFSLKGALVSLGGIYAIKRFGESLLTAASDLTEVSSKFNVVFEGQTALAEKWSKTLVNAYAMSRREAKEYLSSVQDLLVPMGMNAKAAGVLSNEIVKLSADLGSFNNLPTAQVMADIQSALVGNYETMKKYGVVLNVRAIEEKALAMGLAKTKDALTTAHKAHVAYKLIVAGSQAAIGDMSRTSEGYANQTKQLMANIENLQASMGEELLPTAIDVVKQMNAWVKANEGLLKQEVAAYVDKITKSLKTIVGVYNSLPEGTVKAVGAGIVGKMLFGGPAAPVMAAMVFADIQLKKIKTSLAELYGLYTGTTHIGGFLQKHFGSPEQGKPFFRGKMPERPRAEGGASAGQNAIKSAVKAQEESLKSYISYVNSILQLERQKAEEIGRLTVLEQQYKEEAWQKTLDARKEYEAQAWEGIQAGYWAEYELMKEVEAGVKESLESINEAKAQQSEIMKGIARQTGAALQQIFANLFFDFMTGELKSLKDYGTAVFKALISIAAQALAKIIAMKVAMAFFTGGGDFAMHPFGFHQGGVVGDPAIPRRTVPSHLFLGAPKLHSGLKSDEYPAILQRGETVIPAGGTAAVKVVNYFYGDIRDESDIDEIGYRVGQSVEDAIRGAL